MAFLLFDVQEFTSEDLDASLSRNILPCGRCVTQIKIGTNLFQSVFFWEEGVRIKVMPAYASCIGIDV